MSTDKTKKPFKKENKWDILQCGLRNKPKSIKIIAEAAYKSIFRSIFAYSYFAFDHVF